MNDAGQLSMRKPPNLVFMLVAFTVLFIAGQLSFFIIHFHVSDLLDTLARVELAREIFTPVIIAPLIVFVALQLLAYVVFVIWIWFITQAVSAYFKLRNEVSYCLGLLFWTCGCLGILGLNAIYFPQSFFAAMFAASFAQWCVASSLIILLSATSIAYLNVLRTLQHRNLAFILLIVGGSFCFMSFLEKTPYRPSLSDHFNPNQPNIIIIGLDSVRPDFISFFVKDKAQTPHLDAFLRDSLNFSDAYTPLARTFPSWISLLTAKYPKHHSARLNLADPEPILLNDSLVKNLKAHGYETIYGTDEPRFTDIDSRYGFDQRIGPKGGAVEFLIAGLSDFPLSNLLTRLPSAQFWFPYLYANRAKEVTYDPADFLQLVNRQLARRNQAKPLFLALHLCLAHWPFRWARDAQAESLPLALRYLKSIEGLDRQFDALMQILSSQHLLTNSIVIVFSDHGVTLGLPRDRTISAKKYQGNLKLQSQLMQYRHADAPLYTLNLKRDFSLDTSYGQASDVLSLKQYHIILGIKYYHSARADFNARTVVEPVSLMDIAPTVLDALGLPALTDVDGHSLLRKTPKAIANDRSLFFETADSFNEIETDVIEPEKVLNHSLNAYQLDTKTNHLIMRKQAVDAMIKNKQRAVLWNGWLLARYPTGIKWKLHASLGIQQPLAFKRIITPPYLVLVNLATEEWTCDMHSALAKSAPLRPLLARFYAFYGDEIDNLR